MSGCVDEVCRASFVAALTKALSERKNALVNVESTDTSSRFGVFTFANSMWISFVQISILSLTHAQGKDDRFGVELKSLVDSISKAIANANTWEDLDSNITAACSLWLESLEDPQGALQVVDLDLRGLIVGFSEIFFNACYKSAPALQSPGPVSQVRDEIIGGLRNWQQSI